MISRILPYGLLTILALLVAAILSPTRCGGRENARRSSCQSNLKQIGLALRQYVQDNDNRLPSHTWNAPLATYAKTDRVFQCPSERSNLNNDYFFNARFLNKRLDSIQSPQTLILMGDGLGDGPPDATVAQLPAAWRVDKSSPAWRHLYTANYAFADGHVKVLRAKKVTRDFRMVQP